MEQKIDNGLLLGVLTLIGLGLVQVYSASFIFATESLGDGLFFFKKQLLFAAIGVCVLSLAALMPLSLIRRFGWMLWVLAGLGVIATFIPGVGVRAGGALRWLALPAGFRFEPAELLKLSFPIFFAQAMIWFRSDIKLALRFVILALFMVPSLLLLQQPDFGSFAMISMVGFSLLFCFGLKWRYILASLTVALPAFYLLIMRVPYRRARVMAFLDPWSDPQQSGFQVIQSMLSFGSGGLTGRGLGQGQGKLFFLPEAHTDFTLAVFGEEVGFVGFFILLAIYFLMVFRGFQIAVRCQDEFRKTVALGISLVLAFSVFINAGVVMGMLPTKGLTMPFLSYGGSSLVTFCLAIGFLINIEKTERESLGAFSKVNTSKKRARV